MVVMVVVVVVVRDCSIETIVNIEVKQHLHLSMLTSELSKSQIKLSIRKG